MILVALEFVERGLDRAEEHKRGIMLRDKLLCEYAPHLKAPEFSEMERGKPFIRYSDITYSITHTDGCAACAVSIPGAELLSLPYLPELVSESGVYLADEFECPCEIGIDIEMMDRDRGKARLHAIAARYYTEGEARSVKESGDSCTDFYKIWSAKESMVKCTGEGLSGVGFADTASAGEMGFTLRSFLIKNGETEYSGALCRGNFKFSE